VEYLRGNAPASPTGLFVICRYLSAFDEGQHEDALRGSLQVLRSLTSAQSETSAVLKASLAVGEGLGLISRRDANSPWALDPELRDNLLKDGDGWPRFRGELLYRIGSGALKDISENAQPSDLALGLTWFLQFDPICPPSSAWSSGLQQMVNDLKFEAIVRSEQWRPFQRWAVATGLAHRCDHRDARVLIPDPSTAISDQLPYLPTAASGHEWLVALETRLPFFSTVLLNQLPKKERPWESVPPSLVFGLLKLERKRTLTMESSDDAIDPAVIRFGETQKQVTRISVRSAND